MRGVFRLPYRHPSIFLYATVTNFLNLRIITITNTDNTMLKSKSEITVRTQGIKGGKAKFENKGCVTVCITDRGQTMSDLVIDADSFTGSGTTYKRREKTLINIDFENTPIFHGTIEELVAKLKAKTEFKHSKKFGASGLVLGNLWGGGEGSYPIRKLNADTREELLSKAIDMLNDGSLDSGMGFDSLRGALLEITTYNSFSVNDKIFLNEETETVFIGELTPEQQNFLDETFMNL